MLAHADKIIGISEVEFHCEMQWKQGRGLLEIIDNTIRNMGTVMHMGTLTRLAELQMLRNRITDQWPK